MVGGLPATVTVIGGGMGLAMRNRIGIKARHCFNFGQSCTVSMWLWLQVCAGTQFTCLTSAKVQILTQLWLQNPAAAKLVGVAEVQNEQVALLVQKYVLY